MRNNVDFGRHFFLAIAGYEPSKSLLGSFFLTIAGMNRQKVYYNLLLLKAFPDKL